VTRHETMTDFRANLTRVPTRVLNKKLNLGTAPTRSLKPAAKRHKMRACLSVSARPRFAPLRWSTKQCSPNARAARAKAFFPGVSLSPYVRPLKAPKGAYARPAT
jgi:hypothetical protein